jgi:hypothetical protein
MDLRFCNAEVITPENVDHFDPNDGLTGPG